MDSAALATTTLAVLTPYLVKGVEGFVSEAGKDAYEKCKSLLSLLKARLSSDPAASEQLARFEEKPHRYRQALESLLAEKLTTDSVLGNQIHELLQDMGPSLKIIQKINEAEDVTGVEADEMESGDLHVEQEIGKGKGIKGASIKRIGRRGFQD